MKMSKEFWNFLAKEDKEAWKEKVEAITNFKNALREFGLTADTEIISADSLWEGTIGLAVLRNEKHEEGIKQRNYFYQARAFDKPKAVELNVEELEKTYRKCIEKDYKVMPCNNAKDRIAGFICFRNSGNMWYHAKI